MAKKKNSEKIVIIGSNSFSAGSLINLLLNKKFKIYGISRSKLNSKNFQRFDLKSKNFKFIKYDLNKDLKKINNFINKTKPNYIINYASQSMVGQSWKNSSDWFLTNSFSTIKFYELISKFKFKFKLIHVSTPEVYGSVTGRIDESTAFNQSTPYAATRALGDRFVTMWHHNHDVPAIITRAGNIYGRGQRPYRIIPKTFYSIFKNIKIPLHGGGVSKRNFVHGHDSASALWLLLQQGTVGQTYHISSDEYVSIHDLVNKIAGLFGKETTDVCEVAPERVGKDVDYSLGDLKLRNIGWRQMVSLEKGLEEVRSDIRTHLNDISNDELSYIHQK